MLPYMEHKMVRLVLFMVSVIYIQAGNLKKMADEKRFDLKAN